MCFPECFLQGYLVDKEAARRYAMNLGSPAFSAMLQHLASIDLIIVFGLIEERDGELYNTAVVVNRGKLDGAYRKNHLLPSECVFKPGDSYPVFEVHGLKFGVNICFDTNFPDAAAAIAAQGARAILCPANNMLDRQVAEKWKLLHNEIRIQRVLESGLWLISSDVTGESDGRIGLGPTAVIHPEGKVISQVPLRETGMVLAEIEI